MKSQRNLAKLILAFLFSLLACLGPKEAMYPPQINQPTKTVYAINQGWHTGIIFQRKDIDTTVWRTIDPAFFNTRYIEVGWGDAEFYQAEENTMWMGAKALFWPTSTVLHVTGFDIPVEDYFVGYRIYKIELTDTGFVELCEFMNNSFAKNEIGDVVPLGPGLYGQSRFYKASGKYFFTHTCNNWAADALRAAGCPITPAYACTASNAFRQIGKFGEKIGREGDIKE